MQTAEPPFPRRNRLSVYYRGSREFGYDRLHWAGQAEEEKRSSAIKRSVSPESPVRSITKSPLLVDLPFDPRH
jgi:hypothetical protein